MRNSVGSPLVKARVFLSAPVWAHPWSRLEGFPVNLGVPHIERLAVWRGRDPGEQGHPKALTEVDSDLGELWGLLLGRAPPTSWPQHSGLLVLKAPHEAGC